MLQGSAHWLHRLAAPEGSELQPPRQVLAGSATATRGQRQRPWSTGLGTKTTQAASARPPPWSGAAVTMSRPQSARSRSGSTRARKRLTWKTLELPRQAVSLARSKLSDVVSCASGNVPEIVARSVRVAHAVVLDIVICELTVKSLSRERNRFYFVFPTPGRIYSRFATVRLAHSPLR